jgi:PAS domain S-box-containing protein
MVALRERDGHLKGFMKVVRDRTEHKKALDDRETALSKLKLLLGSITDMYFSLDREWRILDINSAAEKFLGHPRSELTGKIFWDIFPETKNTEVQARYQMAMGQQLPVHFEIESKISPHRWAEVHVYPSSTGLEVYFREITERKKFEEALVDQAEELWRSNKELEQFAYAASHDLQGPLKTLASFAELAGEKAKGGEIKEAVEYLDRTSNAARRLMALINDLLMYAHVGSAPLLIQKEVDLNNIMRDVLSDLEKSIHDTQATITVDVLPLIKAEPTQMIQLFQNLIANSLKYHGPEAPRIRVSAVLKDNAWIISVKDNGIGFDPKHSQEIFESFRRLHGRSEYEGTGMGLAICKRIIEQHNGRMWANSKPGKGSTFYCSLPLTDQPMKAAG